MNQWFECMEHRPSSGYVAPEVEVLEISVEKGYSSSYVLGGVGDAATGGSFSWDDEIEL